MNHPRRSFLKSVTAAMTSVALPPSVFARDGALTEKITIGIIADTHIGFVDDAEERFDLFMRDMEAVSPDGLIQLGDFAYPSKRFQEMADRLNAGADVAVHTIGNHDLDHNHTREDCLRAWGIPSPYYTRMIKGLRVIVLDGNERGSPTHSRHGGYPSFIGVDQQTWLAEQLAASVVPVMIVSHQPLAGRGAIDNATNLQRVIAGHKDKVMLCMNGHSHVDQRLDIDGIPYLHCNSASYFWLGGKARLAKYKDPLYATMTIDPQHEQVRIEGVASTWLQETPEDANFFAGEHADLREIVVPEIRDRVLRLQSKG